MVSVGNAVKDLQRHFQYYNPVRTLDHLSLNQKEGEEFQRWYRQMYHTDNKISYKLKELYPQILLCSHPVYLIEDIISLLEKEYKESVEHLSTLGFPQPKSWFDSWSLAWMLKQLKIGTLMDDDEYADYFGLPFTDTDRLEMMELKDAYCKDIEAENLLMDIQ